MFHYGAHWPFAVRWFGILSLSGNARSLIASAIASEQIDARDWMAPEPPGALVSKTVEVLGGVDPSAGTVVEGLGRALWIDFVADTGDDRDVSEAVGRMLFAEYRIADGDTTRVLPRGDMLLFGGDTAYPVSTADEIQRRVILPWNEALADARRPEDEGKRRVLLGIPGNHDWYDGCDGFARMFRKKLEDTDEAEEAEEVREPRREGGRKTGFVWRQLHLDEIGDSVGLFADIGRTLRALWRGQKVVRRKRLALDGYVPVQEATYWCLPLAPGLEAWGVDRQLRRIDFRQRAFFQRRREHAKEARILFVAPDPALAYGARWEPGAEMLEACKLAFDKDKVFYLTGDIHHYERRPDGRLAPRDRRRRRRLPVRHAAHAARLRPLRGRLPRCRRVEAPPPARSSSHARRRGRLHPPLDFVLLGGVELFASLRGTAWLVAAAVAVSIALVIGFYMNAGHHGVRARPRLVFLVSFAYGASLGLLPMALRLALGEVMPELAEDGVVLLVYAFIGAFGFGLFLATLALLGLQHQQAYVALNHPGYKHFVRMCVHPDGRIEAFTIGKDDPLSPGPPVLVDRFVWDNLRS